MNKFGDINLNRDDSSGSPCEYCGHTSVVIRDGTPLCESHATKLVTLPVQSRPGAIDKVAEDLSGITEGGI